MKPSNDIRTDRGTAAQSGAGDLALIGAVPTAFAAPAAHAEPLDVHVGRAAPAATGRHDGAATKHDAPSPLLDGAGGAPVSAALAAPVVHPAHGQGTVQAESAEHAPASPHGSGTAYVPADISHPIGEALYPTAVPANHHTGADAATVAPAAPVIAAATPLLADPLALEAVRASVAHLQETIGQLTGRVPAAEGGHVSGVLAEAQETIDGLGAHLAGATGAVSDHLADVTQHVSDLAVQATGTVTDVVGDAGATAGHLLGSTAATLTEVADNAGALASATTGTVSTVIDTTADHLAATPHAIGALADDALGGVASATGTIVHETTGLLDHVPGSPVADVPSGYAADDVGQHLAGADPVGGITTLVGMVSAADVFQLHDDGGGGAGIAPAAGALGAIDILADAHPADSLLGIADHHDGLLGGITDHHDGLFGHA